jgi:RecG-like helicase
MSIAENQSAPTPAPHTRRLLDPVRLPPARLAQIKRLCGIETDPTNFNLLCLLPLAAEPRLKVARVADLHIGLEGQTVAVPLIADVYVTPTSPAGPIMVRCRDQDDGRMLISYFHTALESVQARQPIGALRIARGKLSFRDRWAQLANPQIMTADEDPRSSAWEAIRPLTEGLSTAVLQRTITSALVGCLDELEALGWKEPLAKLHLPDCAEAVAVDGAARSRLA